MTTFMSAATALFRGPSFNTADRAAFELVMRGQTQLQSVFSKATIDIHNIESLFGAFEMASLLGKLGNIPSEEVTGLRNAIATVIARTIEFKVSYPVRQRNEYTGVYPPDTYAAFADLVRDLQEHERISPPISVITFNYDVALDYALQHRSIPFEYCINGKRDVSKLHVMKLHGSLNWGRCSKCEAITPYEMHDYFRHYRWGPFLTGPSVRLETATHLSDKSHCEISLLNEPFIVPPTWNKGRFHSQIGHVWQAAASHLSEAEHLFIIGYSLPQTDEFFRYFYALGSVGQSIPRTVWVIDPDEEVPKRFAGVLGALTLARGCFQHVPSTFEESIAKIRSHLGVPSRKQ